ncbi:TetR/AcrR family transcriptional regulator [Nocardia beijingensis]|uniref:TetR/AcrR family transcriptional regulator n=1 Tax=Nocardia beijingensis TaxID=95162 RepID=A0ABW7WQZ7_9NOCA
MTSPRRGNRGPKAAAGNRAALVQAAREVFADSGFDAPFSSIARAAGVGQGVLYRHFPTRESIALAVFEENIDGIEALAADPAVTLDDLLAIMVEQITTSAAFIAMIHPTNTDDMRLFEVARRLITLIGEKLEDPRQRGTISADITTADVVLALAMLAAVLSKTDAQAKKETARQAWALLDRALRG